MNLLDPQGRYGFANNNEYQHQREQDWSQRTNPGDYTAEDYDPVEPEGYDIRQGINLDYEYGNQYNASRDN